jgi:TonB family protein
VSGQVVVEVTADQNGEVIAAHAVSGHPLLKDEAVSAARACKFRSIASDGQKITGTLTFTFKLESEPANANDDSEIERARKAVKADPRSAQAHRELAEAYADEDLYEKAIIEFDEALRLKPDDLEAMMGLADAYEHSDKVEDAIATLNKAAAAFPDKRQPLDKLIPILTRKERYSEASQMQKRLCELDSQNSYCFTNLGYYWMQARRADQAIEAYKKASELAPKSASPLHGLGAAYMTSGRFEEALEAYKRALASEPAYRLAYRLQYEIGRACLMLNRREEGRGAFEKSIEINPRFAEGHIALASAYHETSTYDEAERELKKAIEVSATNESAHHALGEIYLHERRLEEAERSFRESLKLNPHFEAPHFGLAASLILRKKGAEAEAAIKEGVRTRVSGIAGYILLGSLLSHLGENAVATDIYRRAYAIDPNNHLLLNDLGYAMLEQNEKVEEALTMIQRAVNARSTRSRRTATIWTAWGGRISNWASWTRPNDTCWTRSATRRHLLQFESISAMSTRSAVTCRWRKARGNRRCRSLPSVSRSRG